MEARAGCAFCYKGFVSVHYTKEDTCRILKNSGTDKLGNFLVDCMLKNYNEKHAPTNIMLSDGESNLLRYPAFIVTSKKELADSEQGEIGRVRFSVFLDHASAVTGKDPTQCKLELWDAESNALAVVVGSEDSDDVLKQLYSKLADSNNPSDAVVDWDLVIYNASVGGSNT